ncbi:hypothetical protein GCK32_009367 [Trichostrongylus colubriformis]|uniref:Uncharacterized protein n=1 Tax=Trichostrongylus colubriformis TaxID=6319 RepID=A0AAN8FQU1_TRICO
MAEDLPMESIDDMPELIDVDLPAQLPSLIEQNTIESTNQKEEFQKLPCLSVMPYALTPIPAFVRINENVSEAIKWARVVCVLFESHSPQRKAMPGLFFGLL